MTEKSATTNALNEAIRFTQSIRELIWQEYYLEAKESGHNEAEARLWADQNTIDRPETKD